MKNQKHNSLTTQLEVPPPFEKTLSGFQQVGKKEEGLGEGIFVRPLILGGGGCASPKAVHKSIRILFKKIKVLN